MEFTDRSHNGSGVVAVSGVVDSASAGQLLDKIVAALLNAPGAKLTVDLRGVTRMTRAGLRGFVVAAKLAQYRGGAMQVTGVSPAVESALAGLGYDHLFKITQTGADASAIPRRAA